MAGERRAEFVADESVGMSVEEKNRQLAGVIVTTYLNERVGRVERTDDASNGRYGWLIYVDGE